MNRLPKKFRRHCWNLFRFVLFCSIVKIVIDQLNQHDLIEHYILVYVCYYAISICGIGWFVWRAYIGMERDLDFYDNL